MQVFIDFIRATGLYEAANEASWMDAGAPTSLLLAPHYLRAHGFHEFARKRRLYHVEGGRFVQGQSFRSAGIGELHTVVVINSDALVYTRDGIIDELHLAHAGHRRNPKST